MADEHNRANGLRVRAAGAGPIRLLLLADHRPSVRTGLSQEDDPEVAGEADDAGALRLNR